MEGTQQSRNSYAIDIQARAGCFRGVVTIRHLILSVTNWNPPVDCGVGTC